MTEPLNVTPEREGVYHALIRSCARTILQIPSDRFALLLVTRDVVDIRGVPFGALEDLVAGVLTPTATVLVGKKRDVAAASQGIERFCVVFELADIAQPWAPPNVHAAGFTMFVVSKGDA
jgi:hypothetical protein